MAQSSHMPPVAKALGKRQDFSKIGGLPISEAIACENAGRKSGGENRKPLDCFKKKKVHFVGLEKGKAAIGEFYSEHNEKTLIEIEKAVFKRIMSDVFELEIPCEPYLDTKLEKSVKGNSQGKPKKPGKKIVVDPILEKFKITKDFAWWVANNPEDTLVAEKVFAWLMENHKGMLSLDEIASLEERGEIINKIQKDIGLGECADAIFMIFEDRYLWKECSHYPIGFLLLPNWLKKRLFELNVNERTIRGRIKRAGTEGIVRDFCIYNPSFMEWSEREEVLWYLDMLAKGFSNGEVDGTTLERYKQKYNERKERLAYPPVFSDEERKFVSSHGLGPSKVAKIYLDKGTDWFERWIKRKTSKIDVKGIDGEILAEKIIEVAPSLAEEYKELQADR